jgi:hypothetical protein
MRGKGREEQQQGDVVSGIYAGWEELWRGDMRREIRAGGGYL